MVQSVPLKKNGIDKIYIAKISAKKIRFQMLVRSLNSFECRWSMKNIDNIHIASTSTDREKKRN